MNKTTNQRIVNASQKIARFERNLSLEKIKKRKAETRHKIEMGGLVVKSKMDKYSKALILGALIDAVQHLDANDQGYELLYKSKGDNAFLNLNSET